MSFFLKSNAFIIIIYYNTTRNKKHRMDNHPKGKGEKYEKETFSTFT